jgi:hypothetical protein
MNPRLIGEFLVGLVERYNKASECQVICEVHTFLSVGVGGHPVRLLRLTHLYLLAITRSTT